MPRWIRSLLDRLFPPQHRRVIELPLCTDAAAQVTVSATFTCQVCEARVTNTGMLRTGPFGGPVLACVHAPADWRFVQVERAVLTVCPKHETVHLPAPAPAQS